MFSALAEVLDLRITISVDKTKSALVEEFKDFAGKVMNISFSFTSHSEPAKIFRAGVTNDADRGIDIYSNWGAVIQVKHLSLDEELAEDITANISSDRIITAYRVPRKNTFTTHTNDCSEN